MLFTEMMEGLRKIFPAGFDVDVRDDGEVVIYTGYIEDGIDKAHNCSILRPMESEDYNK